jgi:hypothetical protein
MAKREGRRLDLVGQLLSQLLDLGCHVRAVLDPREREYLACRAKHCAPPSALPFTEGRLSRSPSLRTHPAALRRQKAPVSDDVRACVHGAPPQSMLSSGVFSRPNPQPLAVIAFCSRTTCIASARPIIIIDPEGQTSVTVYARVRRDAACHGGEGRTTRAPTQAEGPALAAETPFCAGKWCVATVRCTLRRAVRVQEPKEAERAQKTQRSAMGGDCRKKAQLAQAVRLVRNGQTGGQGCSADGLSRARC